ncbi:MAG: branched-chain amino acid transaminase [Planctomycetota bacterium]|nr:branched-chain amino acid transaminase [Planctomycetota bacterium]
MPKIETTAWFDGELVPVQEIRVSALSHSLHYGTGVFEGLRCYAQTGGGGGVFRLRDHVERLHASARVLGYEVPWSVDRLCEATCETLRANAMEAAYIRPLVWLGEGKMGVAGGDNPVHTMIAVWEWGRYLGEEGVRKGIRVLISSYERATGNAHAHRAKITGQYVTSYLAKNQVAGLGLDEALLLDRNGNIPEGTGENLFLARGGRLVTPRDSAAILHGITRDTILTLAGDMGIPVGFDDLSRTDLYTADEAFLTGTAAEVTPIREVDGRPLKESPGPLTRQLQEAYFALVEGRGPRAEEWVTRV